LIVVEDVGHSGVAGLSSDARMSIEQRGQGFSHGQFGCTVWKLLSSLDVAVRVKWRITKDAL
jgi:hypothetical protein